MRTAYFARMCFIAGVVVGTLLGGMSEQYDWPFMPTLFGGAAVYVVGSIVVEVLGHRVERRAGRDES